MSLQEQKERLAAKIARLPEGEAKERAKLHLAQIGAASEGPAAPPPKPPKAG